MSKFKQIDDKLKTFAKKLQVEVSTGGTVYTPEISAPIEERRIVWVEGPIGKAIFIQPYVDPARGASFDSWNFINIAWLENSASSSMPSSKPMWMKTLIKKGNIELLTKEIDALLVSSEENLKKIKVKDLK